MNVFLILDTYVATSTIELAGKGLFAGCLMPKGYKFKVAKHVNTQPNCNCDEATLWRTTTGYICGCGGALSYVNCWPSRKNISLRVDGDEVIAVTTKSLLIDEELFTNYGNHKYHNCHHAKYPK